MQDGRMNHTATLLPDGDVLVVGGGGSFQPSTSAELYHPRTGTWTVTGAMHDARYDHTATLLPNGKVLVAGGEGGLGSQALDSAELYDPRTGRWTQTGSMNVARFGHTATLLPTGLVLVTGGATPREYRGSTSAELYDPRTGKWTITDSMVTGRKQHTATLLPTGQVLVAGGGDGGLNVASAEVYTPLALVARPVSAVAGQTVTVTATTLGPSEPATVYWDDTHTPPVAAGTTTGTGSFVAAIGMPPGPYGQHALLVVGHNSHRVLQASIVRQPHLSLAPRSGTPGMITIVEGKGFGSREVVALRWDAPNGSLLGSTTGTSNGQGAFYRYVRIPVSAPGHHDVYAVGQRSHAHALAMFVVR
jgi:hypothetical protein